MRSDYKYSAHFLYENMVFMRLERNYSFSFRDIHTDYSCDRLVDFVIRYPKLIRDICGIALIKTGSDGFKRIMRQCGKLSKIDQGLRGLEKIGLYSDIVRHAFHYEIPSYIVERANSLSLSMGTDFSCIKKRSWIEIVEAAKAKGYEAEKFGFYTIYKDHRTETEIKLAILERLGEDHEVCKELNSLFELSKKHNGQVRKKIEFAMINLWSLAEFYYIKLEKRRDGWALSGYEIRDPRFRRFRQ
jgi:hypothetical protein